MPIHYYIDRPNPCLTLCSSDLLSFNEVLMAHAGVNISYICTTILALVLYLNTRSMD